MLREGAKAGSIHILQMEEVRSIGGLPCLEHVSLLNNPLSIIPDYRTKVLAQFGERASEVGASSTQAAQHTGGWSHSQHGQEMGVHHPCLFTRASLGILNVGSLLPPWKRFSVPPAPLLLWIVSGRSSPTGFMPLVSEIQTRRSRATGLVWGTIFNFKLRACTLTYILRFWGRGDSLAKLPRLA